MKKELILTSMVAALCFSACTTPSSDNKTTQVNVQISNAPKTDGQAEKSENSAMNTGSASNTNAEKTNAPSNTATPDKAQATEVIDRYLAGVVKVEKVDEYKEARKTVYGDLDGDGDEDIVVSFTAEGFPGTGEGNYYAQKIAAFRNDNGKYTGVTDETVGTKLTRTADITKIENGKILFDTEDINSNAKGKTSFVLKGGKLIEQK